MALAGTRACEVLFVIIVLSEQVGMLRKDRFWKLFVAVSWNQRWPCGRRLGEQIVKRNIKTESGWSFSLTVMLFLRGGHTYDSLLVINQLMKLRAGGCS